MSRPFVSVVTPTYNRTRFISAMVACYKAQTYPKDRMEWIVLDDGNEKVGEVFLEATKGLPNIRYIELSEKLNIGAKRNILNAEAKGDILVCWDDDDYYMPERVSHVVTKLMSQPQIDFVGSSEIYMYYTSCGVILKMGPYGKFHSTNGTMAYRARYAKTHLYDESVTFNEEKSFTNDYTTPLLQLDPMKVMLVISHSENTFNKDRFLNDPTNPFVKKTTLKVRDFIKDKTLREFYSTA
jgi:glycosyltransferase involved in cell wall biosynthesis